MAEASTRVTSVRQLVGRFAVQVNEWGTDDDPKARWLIEYLGASKDDRPVFVVAGLITATQSACLLESALQIAVDVAALMEAALLETPLPKKVIVNCRNSPQKQKLNRRPYPLLQAGRG